MKVAYLGPAGSYSEDAALIFAEGNMDSLQACGSFDEALELLERSKVTHAVLPVENSTEGTVAHTLDLLVQTNKQICAEVLLGIHHQLLSNAATLADVREVVAHSQSLGQCKGWLDVNLPDVTRTAVVSNSMAAQSASDNPAVAAIASRRAADIYSLGILEADIEDITNNTTRFVVLAQKDSRKTGTDKTSLLFSTEHKPGALHEVLQIFAGAEINITKLESRPDKMHAWEYVFFIDIDGHRDDEDVKEALDLLAEKTLFIKVLGSYPKGVVTQD